MSRNLSVTHHVGGAAYVTCRALSMLAGKVKKKTQHVEQTEWCEVEAEEKQSRGNIFKGN